MDFVRQIEANRRALLEELFRRIEEALEPFAYALDAFLEKLFRGMLPTDWREQWHEFVDQQAGQGFLVTPESAEEFEEWMEAWARFCKLLPGTKATAPLFAAEMPSTPEDKEENYINVNGAI